MVVETHAINQIAFDERIIRVKVVDPFDFVDVAKFGA